MEYIFIPLLTLFSAFIGTITGFGTSTLLVPLLSLKFPFAQTLLFVGIIHLFGDIWKMVFFRKGINWKLFLLFGIPGMIVSFLASRLVVNLSEVFLEKMLGVFLIAYVLFLHFAPNWKLKKTDGNALLGGSLSGFFAGISGVGGAVRGAFLTAFNLEKSVYLFTSGLIGFVIDSARLSGYLTSGINIAGYGALILIISIIMSLLGAYIAKKTVDKIPQAKFRQIISVALFLVGLRYLLVR